MDKSFIREASLEDAISVAHNIRDADRQEIWASGLRLPIPCLIRAYNVSSKCWSLVINDQVACIFGVAPVSIIGSIGSPWMIGTDLIVKKPKHFLRKCQSSVLEMNEAYDTLINYVDSRNHYAITWLSWLGFKLGEPEAHGPMGVPFIRFEMRK